MDQNRPIEYEVAHRPAVTRRIHLEIDDRGRLRVVAPRRMSRRVIQQTLQNRVKHVVRFLDRARERQGQLPEYRYVSGERHLFKGQWIPLDIRTGPGCGRVELDGGRLRVDCRDPQAERVRKLLQQWHRRQAEAYFRARLQVWSRAAHWTGETLAAMRLRRMKRTWGSCSSAGFITLNPMLIKAPPECIDYVIAHEICHLREHNHSKAFYSLQEQLYPAWRESKARLAEKAHIYLHQ